MPEGAEGKAFMSRITVIVPNYNGAAFIGPCLSSLMPQCGDGVDVWVVDNASADGSDKTAEAFPGVKVLRMPENTGFTGAVNAGLAKAEDAEYVILLNNDTVVGKHFVRELVSAMERHPDAFSAQARLRRMDDPKILDDAGDLYCALGWAYERGTLGPAGKYNREETVFSACAGAAIYRADVMRKMGGLDPAYFAYLEDVDLGWRAKRAGWRNYFVPSANVLHAGSGTSGSRVNTFKVRHSSRNNVYLLRKNMPITFRILFSPLLAAGFLTKILYFTAKGFGKEYLKGLWAGLRMPLPPQPDEAGYGGFDRQIALEILRNTPACLMGFLGTLVSPR